MKKSEEPGIDRHSLSVISLHDRSNDREYWHSRTPAERMIALEMLRRINYGEDIVTARLQRVLEITERI